jgi:hypothetical protein
MEDQSQPTQEIPKILFNCLNILEPNEEYPGHAPLKHCLAEHL